MISKNRLKQIQSLAYKKYRDRGGLFLAEGPKVVEELLAAYPPAYVAATEEWLDAHPLPGLYYVGVDKLHRFLLFLYKKQDLYGANLKVGFCHK